MSQNHVSKMLLKFQQNRKKNKSKDTKKLEHNDFTVTL